MRITLSFVCIVVFLTLPWSGCTAGKGSGPKNDTNDTSTDTGPVQEFEEFEISTSLSAEIPTVVLIDWSVELDDLFSARVEFGLSTDYGSVITASVEGPAPHRAMVLGLKPDTEYHLRVLAQNAEGVFASQDVLIETGLVPAEFPNLKVENRGSGRRGFYVTSLVGLTQGPIILDDEGSYVWWSQHDSSGDSPDDPKELVACSRARISRDAQAMLYALVNAGGSARSSLHRVALDGSWRDSLVLPYLHHDFVELPSGGFLYLAYAPRMIHGLKILGDRVMEIDPDGRIREIYNIWDHYTYSEDNPLGVATYWPHANALDYLPEEDSILVGFDALGAIVKLDRRTGETLWTFGGIESDFLLDGEPSFLGTQHQFKSLESGLLLFDNGGIEPGGVSRAVEYDFAAGSPEVEEVWSYVADPNIRCSFLGDVTRLDDGNTIVTFSIAGQIHEVDPGGRVVWNLKADIGGALGYLDWIKDLDLERWAETSE